MAMVGATGAVGRIMVQLLEERPMLAKTYRFLASARSAGSKLKFKGQDYTIELLEPSAFKGIDLVIASNCSGMLRRLASGSLLMMADNGSITKQRGW